MKIQYASDIHLELSDNGATDKPCGVRTVVATPKQLLNDT